MATVEEAEAVLGAAEPAVGAPSNQENHDPTADGSLSKMFADGNTKIGTHRTENLFQALEKRTLTEEEQDTIDQRVALQRRMFEEYERRERRRKVAELQEVCPGLADAEAAAALELCGGREDDAAAALVSDPAFLRRVKAACGTGPPAPAPAPADGGGRPRRNARAAAGPRPRLVDPATLGADVFCGTFRGKGFTGAAKGAKPAPRRPAAAAEPAAAAVNDEQEEEEEAGPSDRTRRGRRSLGAPPAAPLAGPAPEAPAGGTPVKAPAPPADAAAATPPPTAPKHYALVAQTSDGRVRAVTDSELVGARRVVGAGGEVSEEASAPASARRSRRVHAAAEAAAASRELSASTLASMMKRLDGMEDDEAAAWLRRMDGPTAATALLELGAEAPERAVALRELMDAAAEAPAPAPAAAAAPEAAAAGGAAMVEEAVAASPPRRSPRRAPPSAGKRPSAPPGGGGASDSEATVSERGEAPSDDDDDDDDDFVQPRSGRARRVRATAPQEAPASAKQAAKKRRTSGAAKDEDPGAAPVEAVATAAAAPAAAPTPAPRTAAAAAPPRARSSAISSRGHTNRGRVKQKSHKAAELVTAGQLRAQKGWYNAGYIFPQGFQSRTLFRSSVALDSLCVHECRVLGPEGEHWPAPTFVVVAADRPSEKLSAKSCTGCWTAVLRRINAEIENQRAAGADLPPPPKTAIAGPEYFGLNQPNIAEAIEALDPERRCTEYWAGKEDRQRVAAGLPAAAPAAAPAGAAGAARPPRAPRAPRAAGGAGGGRRRRGSDSDSEGGAPSEDEEAAYAGNKWSAVGRSDRYRRRLEDNGEDASGVDADNPLPDFIDPITLEPVVRPAISPYGHVMGAATWRAVLGEGGACPFTKQPLRWEQCRLLTHGNVESYRDQIIR